MVKFNVFIINIGYCFLPLIFLINCSPISNNPKDLQKGKSNFQYSYVDLIWKDYNRIIDLLSIKYNISNKIVKDILIEYLRINQPQEYNTLTLHLKDRDTTVFKYLIIPNESVHQTVQRTSIIYSIKYETIANLLFDFEIWFKLKEIENTQNNSKTENLENLTSTYDYLN